MKKVTFLTGAGFNVPPSYGGLSTQGLTDAMCQTNPFAGKYEIDKKPPGEYFQNVLTNYYSGKMAPPPTLGEVNFETIAYLVEELFALYSDTGAHNPPNDAKGISLGYSNVVPLVDADIKAASAAAGHNETTFLKVVYNILIEPIIKAVGALDQNASQPGMLDFQTNMLDGIFKDWQRRIYTLNYDTWIAKNANYFDGFSGGDFDSSKVYSDANCDCHYNLHGSVLWRPHITEDRIEKSTTPVDVHGYGTSDIRIINRQRLIPSPIITGYNKSERLARKPYIALHHAFLRDMLDSDFLVVIGYGGGDPHVNEILSTFKGKVLVVDFIFDWVDANATGRTIDPFNGPGAAQLQNNINPYSNGWKNQPNWGTQPLVVSNDGRISVYWTGIDANLYQILPTLL